MNVCPVVVISHRSRSLAEIKWKPSQRPAAWPLHHLPQKTTPPTAGKGTEGHGGTAEKTRHTGVQPLNPDVTVKGLRSLLEWYICRSAPRSVQPMHPSEGNAHIYTDATTDMGVCGHINLSDNRLICSSTHSHIRFSYVFTGPVAPLATTRPYWPYISTAHPGQQLARHPLICNGGLGGGHLWLVSLSVKSGGLAYDTFHWKAWCPKTMVPLWKNPEDLFHQEPVYLPF